MRAMVLGLIVAGAGALAWAAEPRKLGELLDESADAAPRFLESVPRMKVDDARVEAAGIRKLTGKRIALYTDLPADAEVDALPQVFDAAFPQYCRYFGIDPGSMPDWSMTGFIIKDRERFRRAGLIPGELPNFVHGYARNHELWLYEQPTTYYRRHLLVHEGVHGFMNTRLGSCGPPWYMEGMAELLGTHRWHDGTLTLGYMPRSKDETPDWGRVKIIKDEMQARRGKRVQAVVDLRPIAYLDNDAYAWSWALASLLDGHPRYQARFRSLGAHVLDARFNERFYQLFDDDWQQLAEEWQLFVSGIEYGYDVARNAVTFAPGKPLVGNATASVAADRGWQSSGIAVEAGRSYALRAQGRYQIAREPKIWWCEPGGVSIRYYQGRPLGQLLVAVRSDDPPRDSLSGLLKPTAVGLAATLTPDRSGTLYFKINESPAEWSDNAGTLSVVVQAQ